jgi:hypothetical protein
LQVKTEGGDFQVEVLLLSEMRGPAAVAQTLYRETESSKELRLKLAAERKVCCNLVRCLKANRRSEIAVNSTGFGADRDFWVAKLLLVSDPWGKALTVVESRRLFTQVPAGD